MTGHELPPRLELLDAYIKTPKFIRAFRVKEIMDEYGGYFDDLGCVIKIITLLVFLKYFLLIL